MVVYRHLLEVSLDGPSQRHHDLVTGEGDFCTELVISTVLGPGGQDLEQVAADQIRLGKTSGDVHAVRLLVVESDPSLDVSQTLEGVVSQLVNAVIVGASTSKL